MAPSTLHPLPVALGYPVVPLCVSVPFPLRAGAPRVSLLAKGGTGGWQRKSNGLKFKLKYQFLLLPRAPRQSPCSCPCPAPGSGFDSGLAFPPMGVVGLERVHLQEGPCDREARKGLCSRDRIGHGGHV